MTMNLTMKAIILLSGGLDSATCLAFAKSQKYNCYTLSFDYGQRNKTELLAAKKISDYYQVPHKIVTIPIDELKSSALTDQAMDVPEFSINNKIPITYVPARNTIFLAFAVGWAEVLGIQNIFIGCNAIDYPGYPDCRPEYISAFQTMANLATKKAMEGERVILHAPLIDKKKFEIIALGAELKVPYHLTVSCYAANSKSEACGKCDSCGFRKKGFIEAGIIDPTIYYKESQTQYA